MSDLTEIRRVFLIVSLETGKIATLRLAVESHVGQSTIFDAQEFTQAEHKIENVRPHVLILDNTNSKLHAMRLAKAQLKNQAEKKMAVIILSDIPEPEEFVDFVVSGQLQFLKDAKNNLEISKCFARALNFLSDQTGPDFNLRFLAPGDTLIREGEKGLSAFVVRRGTLRVHCSNQGRENLLGEILPGDFVGEMAYINGEPRSATVTATTDCEVIEIPFDHLDHVLFQKPAWTKALMRTLSKRIKVGNERIKAK